MKQAHVFSVSTPRSTFNHTPLKYRCLDDCNVGIRHVYLTLQQLVEVELYKICCSSAGRKKSLRFSLCFHIYGVNFGDGGVFLNIGHYKWKRIIISMIIMVPMFGVSNSFLGLGSNFTFVMTSWIPRVLSFSLHLLAWTRGFSDINQILMVHCDATNNQLVVSQVFPRPKVSFQSTQLLT